MDNRTKKIAKTMGVEAQLEQTVEECSELILAIQKYKRARGTSVLPAAVDNLWEETADVYIMVNQLYYLFGASMIQKIVDKKLDRQIKRMEKEGYDGKTE